MVHTVLLAPAPGTLGLNEGAVGGCDEEDAFADLAALETAPSESPVKVVYCEMEEANWAKMDEMLVVGVICMASLTVSDVLTSSK
jgi:hypothetical protein